MIVNEIGVGGLDAHCDGVEVDVRLVLFRVVLRVVPHPWIVFKVLSLNFVYHLVETVYHTLRPHHFTF